MHTPRFCGLRPNAGDLLFPRSGRRPSRTSWLTVGIRTSPLHEHTSPATSHRGSTHRRDASTTSPPRVDGASDGRVIATLVLSSAGVAPCETRPGQDPTIRGAGDVLRRNKRAHERRDNEEGAPIFSRRAP